MDAPKEVSASLLERALTRLKRTRTPALRYLLLRSAGLGHWLTRGHAVRRRVARRYVASDADPRLHIGAGPMRLPGWLNTDLISGDVYLDLTRPLPFRDATFSYVFGEHVIEHIDERSATRALRELHRVLRPGGVLRLTTPDLRKIIDIYADRNPVIDRAAYARFLGELTGIRFERGCQMLNAYMRLWGHQYIYDEEDLSVRLYEAGFAHVERREPGESAHELLRGLERHGGEDWVNRAEAMCLEATR
jgi:predicted SAM-dependent methyltransferase